MKILVVTEYSDRYQEIANISIPNAKEYCAKHNYRFHVIKLEDGDFHYRKHEYFKEAFKNGCDLIAYRDIDAMFTNLTIPYESFINYNHDLFITKDFGGINGGSLIIKNTKGGQWVNDFILSQREKFNNEQEVMEHFITSPEFSQYVKLCGHPSFNSYQYEHYPEFKNVTHEQGQWQEGDFLLHTPALPLEKRAEILKNINIIR